MKIYEVSFKIKVSDKVGNFETDEHDVEELVRTGLYEGRDNIIEKVEEVRAREIYEEEVT